MKLETPSFPQTYILKIVNSPPTHLLSGENKNKDNLQTFELPVQVTNVQAYTSERGEAQGLCF